MGCRITILLVDDDDNMRLLMRKIIERVHPMWRVVEAQNGLEGLEYARSAHPDVIVLDYRMPMMNGYEVAERLQQIPETRHIPLILSTSENTEVSHMVQLCELCQAILPKPFSRKAVETALRSVIAD